MPEPGRRTLLKNGLLSLAGVAGLPSLSTAVQTSSTPYNRPKLKITDIRTAEVRVHGYQVHVRVYTDQGLFGQGESTDAAMGSVPLIRSFARLLVGQDPLNVEAAFERIRTSGIFAGAQCGQYVTALTGIEIALWDLAGKALGLPVYQLLGGKVRDRVRLYCDSGAREMIPGDEQSKARIHADPGAWGSRPRRSTSTMRPIRRASIASTGPRRTARSITWSRKWRSRASSIPTNFDLAVDMHGRYDAGTGKRVAKEVEPFKLLWLEEPVPAENIDAMRDIRAVDEHAHLLRREHLPALGLPRDSREARRRHHHARHPEVRRAARRRARSPIMAHTYYVPVAPHCGHVAHRHDGHRARVRRHSELPGPGMALDRSPRPVEELGQGRRNHPERLHHTAGPAGHWRGDERGRRSKGPGARNAVVRARGSRLRRHPMRITVRDVTARLALAAALLGLSAEHLGAAGHFDAAICYQVHARLERRALSPTAGPRCPTAS